MIHLHSEGIPCIFPWTALRGRDVRTVAIGSFATTSASIVVAVL